MKKIKVFVSSTIYDLLDIRGEVKYQLSEWGLNPVMSEMSDGGFENSGNGSSIKDCIDNLCKSDYFIIILNQRYGKKLPPESGYEAISATHLEYKCALNEEKNIFFFVRKALQIDYDSIRDDADFYNKSWEEQKVNLKWINKEQDLDLLRMIESHGKLRSPDTSNTIITFTDSVDLKKRLSVNFLNHIIETTGRHGLKRVRNYLTKLNKDILMDKLTLSNKELCSMAYINGLERTKNRFLATSFLSSEFWYSRDIELKEARKNLRERLKEHNGDGRILLILEKKWTPEWIEKDVEKAFAQATAGEYGLLEKLNRMITNLKDILPNENMKSIPWSRVSNFPYELDPREGREFILYDDFRIDSFKLIDKSKLESVRIHKVPKTYLNKDSDDNIVKTFDMNWNSDSAEPISQIINSYKQALKNNEYRIKFSKTWIDQFTLLEATNNEVLLSELKIITNYLKKSGRKYHNYLDVGIGTARFPIHLINENLVRTVNGIDNASSVSDYIKSNSFDFDFNFELGDICNNLGKYWESTFDLITCTFGTLSHIRDISDNNEKSRLEMAIANMIFYLKPKGEIIISNWSLNKKKWNPAIEKVCKMIYKDESSLKKLRKNTATKERLDDITKKLNCKLRTIENDKYFDIYYICKLPNLTEN